MVCGDGFDPGQNGIVKGGERQKNKIKNKNKIKRGNARGDETEKDLLRAMTLKCNKKLDRKKIF